MKVVLISIILLSSLAITSKGCSELSLFLKSFTNHIKPKLRVELFTCYEREQLKDILKCVELPINFSKIGNFNIINLMKLLQFDRTLFIVDLRCNGTKDILEDSIIENFFVQPNRWLILKAVNQELPNIQNLPNSDIMTAEISDKDFNIRLKNFYRIEKDSPLIFENYGFWSPFNGLHVNQLNPIISRRRNNLLGKILRTSVVMTHNESINHLEDYKDKHIDSIGKVNYVLMKYLIESLNGTMETLFVNTWGYKDSRTGEWSGMIGDLVQKKADIGGTALFITINRIAVIDYVSMTTPTEVKFIFREPPLSYVTNIYTLPFTRLVWICSTALVCGCVLIILITTQLQIKIKTHQNETTEAMEKFRFSDYILLAISAVCQMGSLIQPKITSARISTIFFLIALLFLYTSYTANIVALLQSTTKSIQTLQDLLDSPIKLGAEDTPYHRYYFPNATEPIQREIYRKKMMGKSKDNNGPYLHIAEGIDRVRKELFAFHVELGTGYKLIEDTFYEHEKCNLKIIDFLQVIDPWLAIQKNSTYKELLKVNLFKIREHGIQGRERKKIYTELPKCSAKGKSFESVRLHDCYAAIVIFLVGFCLAVTVLIVENFLQKYIKSCML